MSSVVIIGAGGHALVVADALLPEVVAGHLSPTSAAAPAALLGARLGDDGCAADLATLGHEFAIGVGFVDRKGALFRSRLFDSLAGVMWRSVLHPSAVVSSSAVLGNGVFVGAGAVVGPGATLGDGVIINTGAVVEHECRVADNAHVAPGVVLSGSVSIGADSLVGVGATVRNGIEIGDRVVVGGGAVVVADIPADDTVIGVPARSVVPEQ